MKTPNMLKEGAAQIYLHLSVSSVPLPTLFFERSLRLNYIDGILQRFVTTKLYLECL